MKSEVLDSEKMTLNRRYEDAESNEALVLVTLLDPRLKGQIFSGVHEKIKAKELLDEKVVVITSTNVIMSIEYNLQNAKKKQSVLQTYTRRSRS